MIIKNRSREAIRYEVRSNKGRKEFDRLEGKNPETCARAFAQLKREAEGGWAEILKVSSRVVERRR